MNLPFSPLTFKIFYKTRKNRYTVHIVKSKMGEGGHKRQGDNIPKLKTIGDSKCVLLLCQTFTDVRVSYAIQIPGGNSNIRTFPKLIKS